MGSTNNKNKEEEGWTTRGKRLQCSLTGRLVRSRMRWAGHLVRMDAGKLAKRAEVKMGRPQLRWEDCGKEGYEKIGGG